MNPARRDALLLFALALAVNSAAAVFVRTPGYMDSAYYYSGALRLVQGHGLTEPYLWNYLGGVESLPAPAFLYWMPLTSLVAAAAMLLLGSTFRVAQAPFVLLAALVPVFTYWVSLSVSGDRRSSIVAGLLGTFSAFYVVFLPNTDAFALFALLGGFSLVFAARGITHGQGRWFALAGALAGLAHLARADGALLLLVILWGVWGEFASTSLLVVVGYFLVMAPWFLRNLVAVGAPFAPGGLRTLWLTEYNDLFNYPPNTLTLEQYLAQGWEPILGSKLWALGQNLQTIIAVQGLIFLAPFIVVGMWQLRRNVLYRLALRYAALLYFVMTFVFTFPGVRGGLLHSGAALLPFFMSAGVLGLNRVVAWAAVRRPSWEAGAAQRVFGGAAVVLAAALTIFLFYSRVVRGGWSDYDLLFAEVGAALPPGAVVASNNPPGVFAASGRAGVFIPNGGSEMLLAVIEQYGVDYVLLDANHAPELTPLYEGELTLPVLCPPTEPADGVLLFAVEPCDLTP